MVSGQQISARILSFDVNGSGSFACIDLRKITAARKTPLPKCLLVVLDNLCRQSLRGTAVDDNISELLNWTADANELSFPLVVDRVLFPDSSGLPALMDLAAARDAVRQGGGDPALVEPTVPVTLVIDHSLIVDHYGRPDASALNEAKEIERNGERYAFLKWAEKAFGALSVVPPGSGIIHQVHLEKLAQLIKVDDSVPTAPLTCPEFVLGCDSHTTMINSIGLLAWGVGGIEGESAMLGFPYSVRLPRVIGVRLTGQLGAGVLPTDLVLTITHRLRKFGVTGAFVEFFGSGVKRLSVPDRATIANMAPEYGATTGFFAVDDRTLEYLGQSGRDPDHIALVESYTKAAGLFRLDDEADPEFSSVVEIDLSEISPCVAGPKRPQDLVPLKDISESFRNTLLRDTDSGGFGLAPDSSEKSVTVELDGQSHVLTHGSITIAAITSCTNTSNPTVMMGAGLLARNARQLGLNVPPFVKTSMAPGSKLVRDYLTNAGLLPSLQELGFHIVGYGCTTCSGKSGPIDERISRAVIDNDIVAASVLSGNRNFEGRIHKTCRANFLASPVLVVAFALAGRVDIDFETEPLGHGADGTPVFLKDIWPDRDEITALVRTSQVPARFSESYSTLFQGSEMWNALKGTSGQQFEWDDSSTYLKRPPFFELEKKTHSDVLDNARVLVMAGDSLTTDHVTPSGEILPDSLAGQYLIENGVAPKDFNAVTQRRGNHEFMARITFGNQRMKNRLAGGVEGGLTRLTPDGDVIPIFDAANWMRDHDVAPIVIAGRDYGMGSSRDWAAKGPALLGVRIVLAQSFERIHRSNLVGMGILPLVFEDGCTAETMNLTGFEAFTFKGLNDALKKGDPIHITARSPQGIETDFRAAVDISNAHERHLLQSGGIFQTMLQNCADSVPGDRSQHLKERA